MLDGIGVGELPDAFQYSDEGSNTLGNLSKVEGGLHLPNFEKLGFGNIIPIKGVNPQDFPLASFGKMNEASSSKDSISGHWEIAGVKVKMQFPFYPKGFSKKIIDSFLKESGLKGILGNYAASGTVILNELGTEHIKTGYPIIYTSADSVFQIAAHELAEELDMDISEVSDTLKISGRAISMDAPFIQGDENRLIDILENEEQPSPDYTLMPQSLRREIERALSTLSEIESEVIKLYFGLNKEHLLTLEEIGEKFNLTRERVRQIKEKAIRRLRHASRSKNLHTYLG